MQEQMTDAVSRAAGQILGSPPQTRPSPDQRPGSRILAAMIAAREDRCPCRSCGLLRQELDDTIGAFLKAAASDATGHYPPA